MRDALEPTNDPAWVLEQPAYDPVREHDAEARFAVGNGFLGVRGARETGRGPAWASWTHTLNWACSARTYVAGLFDLPDIEPPVPALIPAPDWLRVQLRCNGEPVRLRSGDLLLHRRRLDMRRGVLLLDWHQRTPAGAEVCVRTLRLVSLSDRRIGLQLLRLKIKQAGVRITFDAGFGEGGLGLEAARLEQNCGVWRTEQKRNGLVLASAVALRLGREELVPSDLGQLRWSWNWTSDPRQVVSFERIVSFGRDDGGYGRGARRRVTPLAAPVRPALPACSRRTKGLGLTAGIAAMWKWTVIPWHSGRSGSQAITSTAPQTRTTSAPPSAPGH